MVYLGVWFDGNGVTDGGVRADVSCRVYVGLFAHVGCWMDPLPVGVHFCDEVEKLCESCVGIVYPDERRGYWFGQLEAFVDEYSAGVGGVEVLLVLGV